MLKDLKDAPPIHEYLSQWQSLLLDYKEQGSQSCLQWEVLAHAMSGQEDIIKRELVDELEKQGKDMDAVDEYNTSSPNDAVVKTETFLDLLQAYVEALCD